MKNKLYKAISKSILASCFLIFICAYQSNAQNIITSDEDGIKTTNKGNLIISHDEFTGEVGIIIADTLSLSNFYEDELGNQKSYVMPMFAGKESDLKDSYERNKIFGLTAVNIGYDTYLSEEMGNMPVLYLIDGKRNSTNALYFRSEEQKTNTEMLIIKLTKTEWEQVIESDTTKFRIERQVFSIDKNTKDLMVEIFKEYKALKSDHGKKDNTQKEMSTPFEIKWEGDIERSPLVQPLPDIDTYAETPATIRFEVKPDGSIGRIILLGKMNSKMEKEIKNSLRSWRFSRLPSGVPQQSQWGTITFRFVLE